MPRLTPLQKDALDALDATCADDAFSWTCASSRATRSGCTTTRSYARSADERGYLQAAPAPGVPCVEVEVALTFRCVGEVLGDLEPGHQPRWRAGQCVLRDEPGG